MPAGRPSKYKPEYCQQLIDFMSQGYSYTAFAGNLGVALRTLYEWEQSHPEFLQAKNIAVPKSQKWWEGRGMDALFTDKETRFNATVWVFTMKNRFGWRDRIEENPKDAPKQESEDLSSVSDEELISLARANK